MRQLLVALAVLAAGCGGSDHPPPQEPANPPPTDTLPDGAAGQPPADMHGYAPSQGGGSGAVASVAYEPAGYGQKSPSAVVSWGSGPAAGVSSGRDARAMDTMGRADDGDRARDGGAGVEQATKDEDRRISAEIRRQLVADGHLSFLAKNVKIVTVDSRVTLRGPVKSETEKNAVEEYVRQTPGVSSIDDRLEVKK